MPKSEFKFDSYFKLPNPGLRSYFAHVKLGQPEVYRTPFAKNETLQQLLSSWDRQLRAIQSEWPTLYEFENDLRSKVGPMSVMFPLKERMSDIDAYYDLISLDQEAISMEALMDVVHEWSGVKGLHLRSQVRTVNEMKKSTNSGSPYFTKRKAVTFDTIPVRLSIADETVLQVLDGKRWNACAVLGWRGQEGGPKVSDVKQRVVWMFPYAINIEELRVYQPLIACAQSNHLVPAWESMEAVDERITRLFDTKDPEDLVICTDFSKFDQHFNAVCQDGALTILRELLDGDGAEDWLLNVFPIKYMIPLAYDWKRVRTGRHGMGSGSGGTNADETLLHRALQFEAARNAGKVLNPNSQCLGDDGVLSYPGITVEDVVRSYTAHGLEMNKDKQYASKLDCTYLRRWHHANYRKSGVCVGVYSTMRALGRLCMQERYYDPDKWSNKMVALRQLSIIENVKWHPLREEFASFCMKRDKYRLGLDIPGFLDDLPVLVKEATDYMPDFLGYTKSLQSDGNPSTSINDWWIVNWLKSQR